MSHKWKDHIDEIKAMVAEGKTDSTIGDFYGVSDRTISSVRHRHKIPANARRGGYKGGWKLEGYVIPPSERDPIKTYKTKEGHTVKVYAPLYATGALVTDCRIRPTGRLVNCK